MYRVVATLDDVMWYVTSGYVNKYTMTRCEDDALHYVDQNDAIAVKFITSNIISQDIALYVQHSFHSNTGTVWKATEYMIPSNFLEELFAI